MAPRKKRKINTQAAAAFPAPQNPFDRINTGPLKIIFMLEFLLEQPKRKSAQLNLLYEKSALGLFAHELYHLRVLHNFYSNKTWCTKRS